LIHLQADALGVETANSETTPLVVILPILCPLRLVKSGFSVNQSAPSEPEVIPKGARVLGRGYSVITPAMVTRPILLVVGTANQSAPSGPVVMPDTPRRLSEGFVYSVITPAVVIRPIFPIAPS